MERRPQHLFQPHYRSANSLNRRVSMTCNCIENPNHRHLTLHNRTGTLRCASNPPVDSKSRPKRDFRFQVIELREGPKWFIWPSNKSHGDENNLLSQEFNQENQGHRSRSQVEQESRPIPIKSPRLDGRKSSMDAYSEPSTSRRRVESEQLGLRMSPASLSSGGSNQSSLSSGSTTFQILSVSSKWEHQSEDEEAEDIENGNRFSGRSSSHVELSTPLAVNYKPVSVESNNN
ncbi:unnamed protein product [Bursaphelenchus xylophilus]|uniref:(pine wood nematode) hypothetical protein n=1 Tax=Bursaphelenchus xylophilus TaxID=6326 RepID=A0A1I7SSP2_BURXY|nr:unnamed protein product [Bursaphelenchus xylophilus]CAG9097352.1 unnamed protein product [Bursaphelenchus xylophilus]